MFLFSTTFSGLLLSGPPCRMDEIRTGSLARVEKRHYDSRCGGLIFDARVASRKRSKKHLTYLNWTITGRKGDRSDEFAGAPRAERGPGDSSNMDGPPLELKYDVMGPLKLDGPPVLWSPKQTEKMLAAVWSQIWCDLQKQKQKKNIKKRSSPKFRLFFGRNQVISIKEKEKKRSSPKFRIFSGRNQVLSNKKKFDGPFITQCNLDGPPKHRGPRGHCHPLPPPPLSEALRICGSNLKLLYFVGYFSESNYYLSSLTLL